MGRFRLKVNKFLYLWKVTIFPNIKLGVLRNKVPLRLALLFILFVFSPYNLFHLNVYKDSSYSDLLTNAITTLGVTITLVISIMVISFETVRRYYGFSSVKTFFNNKYLRDIFSLYIGTLIISGVSIYFAKRFSDIQKENVLFYIAVLYIFSLSILFFYLKRILRSVYPYPLINTLLSSVRSKHIYRERYNSQPESLTSYADRVEDNPIYILKNATTSSLKDGQRLQADLIIDGMTQLLQREIEYVFDHSPDTVREAIKGFRSFYVDVANCCIELKDEETLSRVFDCIEAISNQLGDKKAVWYLVRDVSEISNDIVDNCIRNNLEKAVTDYVRTHMNMLRYQLRNNCPREDELSDFTHNYGKHDTELALQWNQLSFSGYLFDIGNKIEECIKRNLSENVISDTTTTLELFLNYILDISSLGYEQKGRVLGQVAFQSHNIINKYIEHNPGRKLRYSFFMPDILQSLCVDNGYSNAARQLLRYVSANIVVLLKNRLLDSHYLNDIGAEGRGMVNEINSYKLNNACLLYIIKLFAKVREICCKNLDNSYFTKMYVECYDQLNSIYKWDSYKIKRNENLTKKIESELALFTSVESYRQSSEDQEINWQAIMNETTT